MEMFLGQFDVVLDHKWRLVFPAAIKSQIGKFVYITNANFEEQKGCLVIKKPTAHVHQESENLPFTFKVKVSDGRIVIPKSFRDSISFYFGKKITLVGKGNFIELWPRR